MLAAYRDGLYGGGGVRGRTTPIGICRKFEASVE